MKKGLLKTISMISACLAATASLAPLGACGGVKNKAGCLNVFCMEAGYGVDWCEDLLSLFVKQDWVQEKYPKVSYNFQHNDQKSYVETKLKAGKKNNQFDLLFGEINQTYIDVEKLCAELTEKVYRQNVPGEAVTYEEKCFDSYNQTNRFLDGTSAGENNRYYIASWAGGMNGIFYNEDLLREMEISVPRTTDELTKACETIMSLKNNKAGKYDKGYSFILHKGLPYINYLFPIWWAQYEGLQGYNDFYNGISDEMISRDIFRQEGRLHSLKVFEDLFFYDNDAKKPADNKAYLTPSSLAYDFKTAQTMFLKGNGVFHINGDWFENEMAEMKADIIKDGGKNYTIKLMRTPIVSALGEKLGISDEVLANIVDYVDGVVEEKPAVSDQIIEKVRAARGIVNASGPYHTSVVPSYAVDKELAMDFLRFMATDVAQEQYIKSTNGASLPFTYNVKVKSPETYAGLSAMQKERLDYFNSDRVSISVLPNEEAFPLVRFGGLRAFSVANFTTVFSYEGCKWTAQSIYDKTISYWNEAKFNQSCKNAGI